MANKVKVTTKLDLDHELGPDHFSTWHSQIEIGFLLHNVEQSKDKYLVAASNLGESASHYLWQRYAIIPTGDDPYGDLCALFDEYFGGKRSRASRLAALFSISQQHGESIQAYRHRVQKEMRVCNLTTSSKLEEVIETVSVHLFARELACSNMRQKVFEQGGSTLATAADCAQSIAMAAQTVQKQSAMQGLGGHSYVTV
eukprot:scpid100763/ scgid14619/ 